MMREPHRQADVRIACGLRAASQCIVWIGVHAGIFKKHGVNVSFPKLEAGGPDAAAGLMRGEWDFTVTGTVPIAEAVLNGGDAVILMRNTVPNDNIVILAKAGITALDQLSGQRIGILSDAYSGQAGVIVRRQVEGAGAKASYVPLGTYRNIHAALRAGDIDAGAFPVDYSILQPDGWNCFETRPMEVPSIVATTRRLIASDRDLVLRVLRGFVEAIHLFKTRADIAVPLLQDYMQAGDRRAIERLHAFYVPLFPQVPRPLLAGGMHDVHDLFAPRYPAAQRLTEADIADSSLIDELEQSGFVRRLYGSDVPASG